MVRRRVASERWKVSRRYSSSYYKVQWPLARIKVMFDVPYWLYLVSPHTHPRRQARPRLNNPHHRLLTTSNPPSSSFPFSPSVLASVSISTSSQKVTPPQLIPLPLNPHSPRLPLMPSPPLPAAAGAGRHRSSIRLCGRQSVWQGGILRGRRLRWPLGWDGPSASTPSR